MESNDESTSRRPRTATRGLALATRILNRVEVTEAGCWEWQGYRRLNGYGQIEYRNRPCLTHRISYEVWKGPIPEGLQIDHLCRNRCCVNPDHLEAVTPSENVRRAKKAMGRKPQVLKTHCRHGHSLADAWTSRRPNGQLRQHCRQCAAVNNPAAKARYYARKKAQSV